MQTAFVLAGDLKFKGFKINAIIANTVPDLIFQRFELANYSWDNTIRFDNQTSTEVSGEYNLRVKRFQLRPYAKLQLISNYLYFDEQSLPTQQASGGLPISISTVGLQAKIQLGEFYFDNNLKVNIAPSALIPMPTIENNFLVYFKFTYAKSLDLRIGLDNFYKSAYNAQAYNPVIQQFYLQSDVQVWGYNLTDAFVSFMVNKVKLSVKFGHVNAGLIPRITVTDQTPSTRSGKALIVTPDYPALRRSFNLHILWPLFD